MTPSERPPSVARGVGLAIALYAAHVAVVFVGAALARAGGAGAGLLGFASFLYVGVAQIVYMGPAIAIAYSRGRMDLVKGLCIAGAVVALLNAACWGAQMMPPR